MPVQLNHTIVHSRDKQEAATFLSELLDLPAPVPYGPFLTVACANGVTLDFADDHAHEFTPQHYAFLVEEAEFDAILARIRRRGLPHWADPFHRKPDEINTNDGGRGVYWDDPNGHSLEILTVPYGGWEAVLTGS
jgi:catechol 2,3-dioxygenase-like lactoylglutathione lyase family enzyme